MIQNYVRFKVRVRFKVMDRLIELGLGVTG